MNSLPIQKRNFLFRIGVEVVVRSIDGLYVADLYVNNKLEVTGTKLHKNYLDLLIKAEAYYYSRYKNKEENN